MIPPELAQKINELAERANSMAEKISNPAVPFATALLCTRS